MGIGLEAERQHRDGNDERGEPHVGEGRADHVLDVCCEPTTPEETNRAIRALQVSCCEAHRYAGNDPQILKELSARGCGSQCDEINSGG